MLKLKVKKIAFGIIIISILYIVFVAISIYIYGDKDEVQKADVAIILGASIWDDEPSPVFEERINHGIWLYNNGYVDSLIFTGGVGEGQKHSEASVAKKYAIDKGVPSEDIYIEEKSTITQENLEFATEIINENEWEDIIIVSDPLHMKRAMLMAKDYGLEAYSSPTPTSKYVSFKSKFSFLAREVYFYIGYKVHRVFN